MASNILPSRNPSDFAGDIEYQVSSLGAAIRMMRDELCVHHPDPEAVAEAVDRLFFLTDGLEAVQARLQRIAESARELDKVDRPADEPGLLQ